MITNPPLAYSTTETARLLGLHPATVRGLIRSGKLPGCRAGRNIRVPRVGIERLLGVRLDGDNNGV